MPIVVDEVVILIEVEEKGSNASVSASSPEDKQAIVSECVERVLEILAQKEER